MLFTGKALIEYTVRADNPEIAERRFKRDLSYNIDGVKKQVLVEPIFEEKEEEL